MMHFRNRLPHLAALVAAISIGASASADDFKVINFKTSVGSFKLLGTEHPAHGKLEINFTGTVLVSGLGPAGKVTITGNLLKEYDNVKHLKQVYHGTGKLTVEGEFKAVQFFGQQLSGTFTGFGIFRFYGEFDKNLNTGEFWYNGGEHHDWGTGGMQATVPGFDPSKRQNAVTPPAVKVKEAPKT